MDKIFNVVNNNGVAEIILAGIIGSENEQFSANTAEKMDSEISEELKLE